MAPDMSDVARLVNADDPAPEVTERAQETIADAAHVDVDPLVAVLVEIDDAWNEATGDEPVWSAYFAHQLAELGKRGYALVRLPEPSVGSYTWEATEADEYHWSAVADVDEKGPYVRVRLAEREIDTEMAMRFALGVYAAAVRSVAQHAAEQADEHNTAAQDAEEGDDRG